MARAALLRVLAALVALALSLSGAGTVRADMVINGCTILSNPTPDHVTVCPNVNLSGTDLSGADLGGADLSGASLAGMNLSDMVLIGITLSNADLTGANLARANLFGAHLEAANLAGTDLTQANLYATRLTGANLTGANLTGANTASALVEGVQWQNTTCPDGTNSDTNGGTCVGHLKGQAIRLVAGVRPTGLKQTRARGEATSRSHSARYVRMD
jgi:uncharacterized protein YjbI with pentapeptide repeats